MDDLLALDHQTAVNSGGRGVAAGAASELSSMYRSRRDGQVLIGAGTGAKHRIPDETADRTEYEGVSPRGR